MNKSYDKLIPKMYGKASPKGEAPWGTRSSLYLDFAATKSLDPRITFTRASTASYFDVEGTMRYAAINEPVFDHDPATRSSKGLGIWEARSSLLKYTEDFNITTWEPLNGGTGIAPSILQNSDVALDGSMTADKVVFNTGAGVSTSDLSLLRQAVTIAIGTQYTLSVYIKGAVGGEKITIRHAGAGNYTLVTLTNQWKRYSVVETGAVSTSGYVNIGIRQNQAGIGVVNSSATVYMWGAQLEAGASPTPYIPSAQTFTSRASTGTYIGSDGLIKTASIDAPRMQYNPGNLTVAPKLLLEESRSNLLTYSEDFSNAAWAKTASTVSSEVTVAPDGTMTADKLVESNTSAWHNTFPTSKSFTIQPYSISVYAKKGERSVLQIIPYGFTFATGYANFDLIAGTVSAQSGLTSASIEAVGNDWYRCTIVSTALVVTTSVPFYIVGQSSPTAARAASYLGDGVSGIYIWGAQLEVGSYPTSYIPTVAAAVTRAADVSSSASATRAADVAVMTGTNFSDWYRTDEGSFVTRSSLNSLGLNFPRSLEVGTDISNRVSMLNLVVGEDNRAYVRVYTNNIVHASLGSASVSYNSTLNLPFTLGYSYKVDRCASSMNGGTLLLDTSVTLPPVDRLYIGSAFGGGNYLNGHLAKLAYYPKAISDSELISITR